MKLILRVGMIVTLAMLGASCVTRGSANRAGYVQVLPSGIISVGGKPVAVDQVGPALKRSGFGPLSPINVHVPEDISENIMKSITISLAKTGFRRVLFIKPKQATADTGDPKPVVR